MTANFNNIKGGIKAILQADTDLKDGDIFDYEPPIQSVNKDPFVALVPSENESDFATNTENKRVYGFSIRVFVERSSRGADNAEALMTAIVDRLLNAFDKSPTLGVNGVLLVKAAPSSWGYVLSDKEYRMAEIKLGVLVWYDTTS